MNTGNHIRLAVPAVLLALFVSGCASSSLNTARRDYFAGNYRKAAEELTENDAPDRDRVLFLMERGVIRQAAGDYTNSATDLIEAYNTLEGTAEISISRDTSSMVVNDNVQQYRGVPFERTLLHVFTAKSHLLMRHWEHAGVEARRIIESLKPEVKKDYPEDAYSRYMAGFCLGMAGDRDNVGLQYRLAQQFVPHLVIDDTTGFIYPRPAGTNEVVNRLKPGKYELVVFTLIGRSPTGDQLYKNRRNYHAPGYATVTVNGKYHGRSYQLSDVMGLAFTTQQKEAIKKMAKTVTRVSIKEGIADELDDENPLIGALFRVIMIGILEQPDTRRWETLPRSLQVARIPLDEKPEQIDISFKTPSGVETRSLTAGTPESNNGYTYIMVVRDMKPVL